VEVQGLEHMVVADHGPKKGMAPQLKPQFNPLFFPFATCLPSFSTPQDYDLKAKQNVTPKAYSQTLPIGRESNDNQDKLELSSQESSTVDTMSTDLIQSELTSPWPDQWQLEGLNNDMTDPEDPWLDLEKTNAWNDTSDTEEPDLTDTTPWGLFGEPRWKTERNNAIGLEPEEDPFPLMLQHPNKDNRSKWEGELSPQTSNDISNLKEMLSLQHDQCNKETLDQRNPENKSQGSTSDNKEGTTDISYELTHQKSKHPTSDNKEGTTVIEPTLLGVKIQPESKDISTINDATRG